MKETDMALADLAAAMRDHPAAAPEPEEPKYVVQPHVFLNRLERAGEVELAGKFLNFFASIGLTLPPRNNPAVAAFAKRVGAIRKAASHRRLDEANATATPLPRWVAKELQEMGIAEAERLADELGVKI